MSSVLSIIRRYKSFSCIASPFSYIASPFPYIANPFSAQKAQPANRSAAPS